MDNKLHYFVFDNFQYYCAYDRWRKKTLFLSCMWKNNIVPLRRTAVWNLVVKWQNLKHSYMHCKLLDRYNSKSLARFFYFLV